MGLGTSVREGSGHMRGLSTAAATFNDILASVRPSESCQRNTLCRQYVHIVMETVSVWFSFITFQKVMFFPSEQFAWVCLLLTFILPH